MIPGDSDILEKLRRKGSRILSFRDLAEALGVAEENRYALRERLDELERRGEIARVRGTSSRRSNSRT